MVPVQKKLVTETLDKVHQDVIAKVDEVLWDVETVLTTKVKR